MTGAARACCGGSACADVHRLASRNAAQLKKLGLRIDVVDSTPTPSTATVIQYPHGGAAAAKAVAAVVPGAQLEETSSVTRVTLSLGTDGKQVSGVGPASSGPSTTPKPARTGKANGLGCID